jgi:murein DD-endopeptidase MepM/ murein hydrolase activator NlpD
MSPPYPPTGRRSTRGWRLPLLALLLTVAALVPVAAPAATGEGLVAPPPTTGPDRPRVPALWMPVTGSVVRGFDARAGPYGPGHRGIDIAAPMGQPVRTPAAGRVVFAGPVAGTAWVSLRVAPGVLVTLGPVLDPAARAGPVRARGPIGRVGPGHGATLHLGVRVNGVYVDPLPYLLDRPRPRLAPLPSPGGLPPPGRGHQGRAP